jgi:predicted AAA+ superfamily ATPase
MIPRLLLNNLKENLREQKIVLLNGPRRSGKRAIVQKALEELNVTAVEFDASNKKIKREFAEVSARSLNELFGGTSFVMIEEAQYLEKLQDIVELVLSGEIHATLIICCSHRPIMDEVLLEVLQMQGLELNLFPPSFYELAQYHSLPIEEQMLEKRLIFGNYPEVVNSIEQAETILTEMIGEVIFTNLGVNDRINKGDRLMRMLQTIAFNIGEPVSYNEIGERADLDNETVERYVDLLEIGGILFRLPCYFNDHRYELKKSHVIYFADNGIRNALIRNFNPPELRNDLDMLWRNWLIAERIKWNKLNGRSVKYKFWRTHTKQTMDFIEFSEGKIQAYKTSWEKKKKVKFPLQFTESYPNISTHVLNRSTYWGFLTKK